MKKVHKLLFFLMIFSVLLVPSYAVKADDSLSDYEKMEQIKKELNDLVEKSVTEDVPDEEIDKIISKIEDTSEYKKILSSENEEFKTAMAEFVKNTLRLFIKERIKFFRHIQESGENIDSCAGIFGRVDDESSTAYMIQKFLNYIKILAPILVVLLSGFDFTKNVLAGDQEEMKKATKKLGIRLACAVGVYLAPLLASFLINFINNSSIDQTCNIK